MVNSGEKQEDKSSMEAPEKLEEPTSLAHRAAISLNLV